MRKHLDPDWLLREYGEKHRTLQSIGDECGVSRQAVKQAADKFGIEYVPVSKRIDIAWLREQREGNKRSQQDIADDLGIARQHIGILCLEHAIKRPERTKLTREQRNARNLSWQNRKYKTDPEYREMKKRSVVRWRKAHPAECLVHQQTYRDKKKCAAVASQRRV